MSGELNSVTIVTPNPAAPEGHDARMVAIAEGTAKPNAPVDTQVTPPADRPAWLPEKFKTPEDMAASYAALEAKLGAPKPADATPPVDPKAAPVAPKDALAITPDAADAAVTNAGLDMAALSTEFNTTGALSEATMTALAAKGFDKATVDSYIAGQQALATAFQAEVKGATPGGAEKYQEMVEWAKVNLTPGEIDAYNATMNTSNKDQAKLAVAGLGARFAAAVGNEPVLTQGRGNAAPGDVFQSVAQMKAAMSDPRYKEDPAYRQAVREKLGRSSIL